MKGTKVFGGPSQQDIEDRLAERRSEEDRLFYWDRYARDAAGDFAFYAERPDWPLDRIPLSSPEYIRRRRYDQKKEEGR